MLVNRILIDTNILFRLEDNDPTPANYAQFSRLCAENNITLHVHQASVDDIERDKDKLRKTVSKSKLAKYAILKKSFRNADQLETDFGYSRNDNDISDCHILSTVKDDLVDFVVTEDLGLHKRAERIGLSDRLLNLRQIIDLLEDKYANVLVNLQLINERFCYEIDLSDAIFDSIREDYDDFDIWFAKCRTEKRKCWIINDESTIAGVVIFNDETDKLKEWPLAGRKVLKICTFKISEKYRGGRLGEQFVRQILWYAYENRYESVYLTAFAKQDILINLISYYGFREVGRSSADEICFEKEWVNVKEIPDRFHAARFDYPRLPAFSSDAFLVPIKYAFTQRLFPEIDSLSHRGQLSLFHAVGIKSDRDTLIPSTSIRKAYVCNAAIDSIASGSDLYFYQTVCENEGISQCLVAHGIVDDYITVQNIENLVAATAKRTVYSSSELLTILQKRNPTRVIRFIHMGYLTPLINLKMLKFQEIVKGHPQSIVRVNMLAHAKLRELTQNTVRISRGPNPINA
ncbi:GNAT family N-acetyltransferase [Phyllobacterium endophyticum]|uniref:GNAT family N-acetyltransferase n=1 Tax=Phyllobacterium endophyticum TaxID=1149773 RepID=UPI0011C8DE43|nr:GNAT family N-acetyltransferase [Phyllobacterium endophyticum]TXR46415.1 GNAT family N-acetyltransferase [Phyllobacterium endophyticum]